MKQDSSTTPKTARELELNQDSSSASVLNVDSANPFEEAHARTVDIADNAGRQWKTRLHPDDQTIITSQPMPDESDTLATFPDGWAECMLIGYVKKQILATPGFSRPIEHTKKPMFRIPPTPDRGLGMFAARGMETGDLILDERPMIVAPVLSDPRTIAFPEHFTEDQILQAAIYETNGYEVDGLKDKDAQVPFGIYTGVWDKLSRLNHSCSPNICRKWNTASFSMQIRAVRDVEEGEELTTAYCAILNPSAKRQSDLAAYGFRCTCTGCLDPLKSDVKREGFSRRPVLVSPFVGKGKTKGNWLDPALKMLAEMEEEGVRESLYYKATLYQLVMACVYMADRDKALMYGRKLAAISRARGESMDGTFTSVKKLKRLPQWGLYRRQAGLQVYR
ncbi:hypothetical protein F5146DRAFT_1144649 [Armillaria mellea]|nr:hypothetical protein F5146DRAFT_1144649 [Armillaria mellea]